jgi:hypothetical protein
MRFHHHCAFATCRVQHDCPRPPEGSGKTHGLTTRQQPEQCAA